MGAQVITEVLDDDGIATMRENAQKYLNNCKIPPIFFSDFECGCGGYIKGLTDLPLLMSLGAANDEQLAYDYGKATALEGTCAGITAAFTPVCDINYNFRNPLVNVRSVSDDPDRMLPLVKNIIKGMQDNGLAATAKHFPGDGVDWRDQHIITTENSMDMDKWWETYGRVYKELIAEGIVTVGAGLLLGALIGWGITFLTTSMLSTADIMFIKNVNIASVLIAVGLVLAVLGAVIYIQLLLFKNSCIKK